MRERRSSSPWYLVTGLIIGVFLGAIYARVIQPVQYRDADPASLSAADKETYIRLIASAFQADGNLERARKRLQLLNDPNAQQNLVSMAQSLAGGGQLEDARALADLASALQNGIVRRTAAANVPIGTVDSGSSQITATLDPAGAVRSPTPAPSLTPTITPTLTPTPRATATSLPTLAAPFVLDTREEVCDPSLAEGLIQIYVNNPQGSPLPGVRIEVSWGVGNENAFFTGLYPQISPGYADFQMEDGVDYVLRVGEGSQPVSGLSRVACKTDSGSAYFGGWRLVFKQ